MEIPAPGAYFRIVNESTQMVLVSNNKSDLGVSRYPVTGATYDDQYFSLVPGTGEHKGTYLIRGKASNNVLYSRDTSPWVGHIGVHGTDQSQYYIDK